MRSAFFDTGAIYSFVNRNDPDHERVVRAYLRIPHLVTHSAVLMEAFSLITKRIRKDVALGVISALTRSPKVEIIQVDLPLSTRAWARCERFADKEWDWIDCTSFEVMDQREMRFALALDHHFVQAGFRLL